MQIENKLKHAACTYWNFGREKQVLSPCGNPEHYEWQYYLDKKRQEAQDKRTV